METTDLVPALQDERKILDSLDIILALEEENDEDLAISDFILNTKNRVYYYLNKEPGVFKLAELGDSYCFTHFRFYKDDIKRLTAALGIPKKLPLKNRLRVFGEEGICILLHRLSYPKRYLDFMCA